MSALGDLLHSSTQLGEAAIDHLQALVGEWALLSDLSFADLLLLVVQRSGEEFLVVAQVRPATGPTAYQNDLVGRRFTDVPSLVQDLPESFERDDRPTVSSVLSTLLETLVERTEERIMLGGTANLTRFVHDFPLTIRPVLEALEEQVVLLKLLGEAKDADVTVRIGHENAHEGLSSTSVVAMGYGSGNEAVARLGVVGPTRMDYPGTMGAVRAVARYVGQILAES